MFQTLQNLKIPILTPENATLQDLVTHLANIFAVVAGIVAFFYLIYAGILYITSANNPDQAKKAQQALINVIIGIAVISVSYLLIQVVGNFVVTIFK